MKCVPWVVAALVFGAGAVRAQEPAPAALPAAPPAVAVPAPEAIAAPPVPLPAPPAAPLAAPAFHPYWGPAEPYNAWSNRMWISNEYLLWWVKNGPLPVPLITASSAADVGTLGAPTTQVLFGGKSIDYGAFSGYRLAFGSWLNWDRTLGIESRWLFLEHKAVNAYARSDQAGNPTVAVPIFDPRPSGSLLFGDQPVGAPLPGEAGLFITSAGAFAGGINLSTSTRLWGTELNTLCNLVRNDVWNVNALVGFRFLDLNEDIDMRTDSLGLAGAGTFAGTTFHTRDRFAAENDFCGGNFGLQTGFQRGCWTFNLNGTVAIGGTHQFVSNKGFSTITNSGDPAIPSGNYLGGLLVTPTNRGHYWQEAFAVVPELQFNVGYAFTRAIRVFAGYSFLYWSNVVRPGEQIDRVVNPTQVPVFGGLGLVGPARPVPLFQQTDFWAQGLNIGLAIQF